MEKFYSLDLFSGDALLEKFYEINLVEQTWTLGWPHESVWNFYWREIWAVPTWFSRLIAMAAEHRQRRQSFGKLQLFVFETHHAAFRLSAKAEETEAAPVATEAVAADLAEALAAAERGEASSSRPAAAARTRGQGFTEESGMCVYWLNFNAFGIVGLSTSRPKRSSSGCKKKHYKHVFYWRNFTEEVLLEKLDWRCVY